MDGNWQIRQLRGGNWETRGGEWAPERTGLGTNIVGNQTIAMVHSENTSLGRPKQHLPKAASPVGISIRGYGKKAPGMYV